MQATYGAAWRSFDRNVRLMLAVAFVLGFSLLGVFGVLFNLYLLRLGYGPQFIGLVNGLGLFAFAALGLPAGAAGVRWRPRRMVLAGSIIALGGLTLAALADLAPTAWRQAWLVATYMMSWSGGALIIVNSTPFIANATHRDERPYAFALLFATAELASFAGSLVGGYLPQLYGRLFNLAPEAPSAYRYALLSGGVLFALAVVAARIMHGITIVEVRDEQVAAGRPPYGLIAVYGVIMLLRMLGEGGGNTFFNLYLNDGLDVAAPQIGALRGTGRLLSALFAVTTPLLVRRWGVRRTAIIGVLGVSAGLLVMGSAPQWLVVGVGYGLMAAMGSLARPALAVFDQQLVRQAWRPFIAGVGMMSAGLGDAAAALGGGYIVAAWGYPPVFVLGAVSLGLAAAVFGAYFRGPRGQRADTRSDH